MPRRLVEVPSARSSRQEQRCHRVVWLISHFESSGVVLLVIPRGARRPVTGRGGRQREGIVRVERTCRKSGGVRTRGCAMRGRECRWRPVGETFGVNGGWWKEAPERVIESRARSLLYRPPYAVPFPRTLPPYLDPPPPRPMEAGISPLCVNPVASSPTPRRSRHPVCPSLRLSSCRSRSLARLS